MVVPAQYHFLWEVLLLACGEVVNGLEYLANWGLARVVVEELELGGGGSECEWGKGAWKLGDEDGSDIGSWGSRLLPCSGLSKISRGPLW